jgi:hypothetical protein
MLMALLVGLFLKGPHITLSSSPVFRRTIELIACVVVPAIKRFKYQTAALKELHLQTRIIKFCASRLNRIRREKDQR